MKKRHIAYLVAALVVLVGILGAVFCLLRPTAEAERFPRVVRIEGAESCFNLSLSWWAWGAAGVAERPASLLVRDGDLLMASIGGDLKNRKEMIFPHLASDGTSLSLEFKDSRGLLGGETVDLELSKDGGGWEWLEKATPAELARLRMLGLKGNIDAARMPTLERLAQANPRLGLMLDDRAALRRVLPLFHPRWLILQDLSPEKEDLATISSRENMELLWIDAKSIESLAFLTRLSGLRRLVLDDWSCEKTGPFPSGCESLESLMIPESDVSDLSPIAHLTGLRELHLAGCRSFTDITGLPEFSALEALTLFFCENVSDLSALKELQGLTRLGLPPGITQEEFAAVIGDHPDLRQVELVGCEEISDLGPLKELPKLEHLVCLWHVDAEDGPKPNLAPLRELKGLRFLMLPMEVFEESPEEVRKLEEALPQCTVAAGGRICLGSGWILMLLPAVALAWFLSRRRRTGPSRTEPRDA